MAVLSLPDRNYANCFTAAVIFTAGYLTTPLTIHQRRYMPLLLRRRQGVCGLALASKNLEAQFLELELDSVAACRFALFIFDLHLPTASHVASPFRTPDPNP